MAVDHVFYCNPSEQEEETIAPIPDWTNLVYREIIERIIERYGISSMKEVVTRPLPQPLSCPYGVYLIYPSLNHPNVMYHILPYPNQSEPNPPYPTLF